MRHVPWRRLVLRTAAGFGLIMVLAAGVHTRLREPRNVAAILAVAVTVSWGRFTDLG